MQSLCPSVSPPRIPTLSGTSALWADDTLHSYRFKVVVGDRHAEIHIGWADDTAPPEILVADTPETIALVERIRQALTPPARNCPGAA